MRIAVVGGCNVDFICRPKGISQEATSNGADIQITPGGVGRNIAENLKNLGCQVTMITAAGNDIMAQYITNDLKEWQIESRIIPKEKTGIYFALLDEAGRMDRGFCDAEGVESLTFEEILDKVGDFSAFDGVVVDANFSQTVIGELAEHLRQRGVPYALEPVSNYKAPRLQRAIKGCTLIKPNRYEAAVLTGLPCTTLEEVKVCAERLGQLGAHNVLISMGREGLYFHNKEYSAHTAAPVRDIVNETGAGDALLSAVFLAVLKQYTPQQALRAGNRAAAMTCQVEHSVCRELSPAILEREDAG